MKAVFKNANKLLINTIEELKKHKENGKVLKFAEAIPTSLLSKSFIISSVPITEPDFVESVCNKLKESILSNRNGFRIVLNNNGTTAVLRKETKEEVIYEETRFVVLVVRYDETICFLYDTKEDINIDDTYKEYNMDSMNFGHVSTIVKDDILKMIRDSKESNTDLLTSINNIVGIIMKEFPEDELVEYNETRGAIKGLKNTDSIKVFHIPMLFRLDSFIYSNYSDTKEHIDLIPEAVKTLHNLLPKYHKDKSDKKDVNFMKLLEENGLLGISKPTKDIKEEKKEFVEKKQEVKEEIKPKEEPKNIIVKEDNTNKGEDINMVRKVKNKETTQVKKEVKHNNPTSYVDTVKENAALREAFQKTYSGVVKSILIHIQTWPSLEDLCEALINERNLQITKYKESNDAVEKVNYHKVSDMLLRVIQWLTQLANERAEGRNTVEVVNLGEGDYLFVVNRFGFPYIIDYKTLGIILQFEAPNKEINIVDIDAKEFWEKHEKFLGAASLIGPTMSDKMNEMDPRKLIIKEK